MVTSQKTDNGSVIKYFLALAKIDSPTGEEQRVAEYIVKSLKGKARVCMDSFGNVYSSIEGRGVPIFFSAHMDNVEPCRGVEPVIEKGYVLSDGSTVLGADDKAAIAAMLALADQLTARDHRPIEFIFTRSEESGNYGAIKFDYSLLSAKSGFCFDSSSPVGTVITASPYYDRFDLKISGRTAHASKPSDGINSLLVLKELLELQELGALDADTLINIGIVRAGDARNAVPGELVAHGELRGFSDSLMGKHMAELKTRVERAAKKYGAQYFLDIVRENPGYKDAEKIAPSLMADARSAISALGLQYREGSPWAVSDANIFIDKGYQCINLGYGGEKPHTKEERIKLSELGRLIALMRELAR